MNREFNRDLIITMRHIRGASNCSSGARAFFVRHGLNWEEFIHNRGITAGKLLDTRDPMAIKLVEYAHGWK